MEEINLFTVIFFLLLLNCYSQQFYYFQKVGFVVVWDHPTGRNARVIYSESWNQITEFNSSNEVTKIGIFRKVNQP